MPRSLINVPKNKTPVESTQQNIPVRELADGIIITKDEKYVKVIEVMPIPFFLKKPHDQNRIGNTFYQMIKSAPDDLHFKSVSLKSDLSSQIKDVDECIASETDLACRKMGKEYKRTLEYGQENGISRRFFLSFKFEGQTKGLGKSNYQDIIESLYDDAARISSDISNCGNDVIFLQNDEANKENAKLLYMLYNRNNFLEEPFDEHYTKIFEKYYKKLQSDNFYIPPTDYIAPKKISIRNSRYLFIDDTYYSFLYIPSNGYNPSVGFGWLDIFINSFDGIDVDVFLHKEDKHSTIHRLKKSITNAKVDQNEANSDLSDSYSATSETINTGYYMLNGLKYGGQDYYNMATIITITGNSIENVNKKKKELIKLGKQNDITLMENIFGVEQTFNAVLPTSMYDKSLFSKMRRNVLTEGAASIYPFTTFQLMDKNGLYIADDMSGSPTVIDLFNRKRLNNPHVFICGETGAGKTITLMLMALRARIKGMPVFILAPEKQDEFLRITNAIGGQFVSIGTGSPDRINIMEIFKRDEEALKMKELIDGTSPLESSSQLETKVATVSEFVQLLLGQEMNKEENQLLNEAIYRTYEKKGIFKDNLSLWADEEHTKYKEMPIFSDLVNELELDPQMKRIATICRYLTQGVGQQFNGQTNINTDNNFIVIGLEHNTKELIGLAIYMAMDYCWSKIKEDRTQNKFLFIDEWWKLAFNPIAAEKSLEISKIARAFGCSMVLATQQMSDILALEDGKYGEKVLNNCATKILMSMKEKDVYSVREMIGLTEYECNDILRFKAGMGMLIAGENRTSLKFNPSETEKLLTFTDNESLRKYAELQQEKTKTSIRKSTLDKFTKLDNILTLDEWLQTLDITKFEGLGTYSNELGLTKFISLEEWAPKVYADAQLSGFSSEFREEAENVRVS